MRGDLIQVYKICHDLYDPITTKQLIVLQNVPNEPTTTNITTRAHPYKITKTRPEYKKYQYFFTNRVINLWNSLPEKVVCAPTMDFFKNQIDIHLNNYKYITNFNLYYTNH